MSTTNPLAENAPTDPEDHVLVLRARAGDRQALEELIQRHESWIYNIAVRMLYHPQDAEDATQEILLKALTRLSSFEGRSSFRTWLYRIVVNHVLNMKRGRAEQAVISFSAYGQAIEDTPDLDLPDPKYMSADANLLVTEAKIACTTGMLLCLDREAPQNRLGKRLVNHQPFIRIGRRRAIFKVRLNQQHLVAGA